MPTPREPFEPFDPMRMFAQLAHYYPSFSDTAMRRMPWKRLLGYWREAQRMSEEEQQKIEDAKHDAKRPHALAHTLAQPLVDGQPVDAALAEAQVLASVTRAHAYEGPAVPVVLTD